MSEETAVPVLQRRTRAQIEQIVAEFAASGVTRTEFCRRQHIGLSTLNRYLKPQQEEAATGTAHGALVAVELASTNLATTRDGGWRLALVLPRGRRIEVEAGFDGPTLQRLVQLVEKM